MCFSHEYLHLGCREKNRKGQYNINYGSRQGDKETTVYVLHRMNFSKTLFVSFWSPAGGTMEP